MAIIPIAQKFHTVSSSVDTTDRGSAGFQADREIYTMQDVIDTVAFDAGSVEKTGTPVAGFNTRWTGTQTVSGEFVPDSSGGGGFPVEMHKGYRAELQWPTGVNFQFKGGVWSTSYPMGNMDAWLAKSPSDIQDFYAFEIAGPGPSPAVQDWTTLCNRFSENIVMGSRWLQQSLSNTGTFARENVIIGTGSTASSLNGYNNQENVWLGHNLFGNNLEVNTSSTVIIGANAFEDGLEESIQYGVYIGRQIGGETLADETSRYNVHIGYRASGNKVKGGNNVCIGTNSGQDINAVSEYNVMVGNAAGLEFTSGDYNTFLGYQSGPANNAASGGDNNTCIGNGAQISGTAVSNEIVLGNASVTVLRCQQNSISALSDERDKKDIEDSDYGLDLVNSLKPRKFVWDPREIDYVDVKIEETEDEEGNRVINETREKTKIKPATDGMKDIGFIAQELQAVDDDFLRLVYDANPDKLEASYGRLVPVLVKAVQELSAKVTALENA